MRFTFLGALLAFASAANATAVLEQRAVSNNNCGRAVAGTAKGASFLSSAEADCTKNVVSVYGTVFVTLPFVTVSTTTTLEAVTTSTQTLTITGSTTTSSILLATETETSISTAYETSTEDQVATQLISSTPVVTLSITVSETSPPTTVTVYTPTYNPLTIAKRATSDVSDACAAPVTQTIPAYASACTDLAEYAAACSLLGVSGTAMTTTTLPVTTVTVPASTTTTSTIISTITTQIDIKFTEIQTTIISTTESTILTLSTATSTTQTEITTIVAPASTITAYVTSTLNPVSTPTVTLPIPSFKVEMIPVAGGASMYMLAPTRTANGVYGTTSLDDASTFTVDTQNRLFALELQAFATFNAQPDYYIEFWTQSTYNAYVVSQKLSPIPFTVGGDLSLTFTHGTGNHNAFTYYASQNQWFYSTPGYENFPTYTAKIHAV